MVQAVCFYLNINVIHVDIDFFQKKVDNPLPLYREQFVPHRIEVIGALFNSFRLDPAFRQNLLGSLVVALLELLDEGFGGRLVLRAIVIGVEPRTSSPVRIPRDNATLQHITIKGLYPCGEGAGYAGGIVSAAIDGERCAESLVNDIQNS